jgi:hypothetical protein
MREGDHPVGTSSFSAGCSVSDLIRHGILLKIIQIVWPGRFYRVLRFETTLQRAIDAERLHRWINGLLRICPVLPVMVMTVTQSLMKMLR